MTLPISPRRPTRAIFPLMAQGTSSSILKLIVAAALMLIAANCFLSYLWWSACYSAWSGIPKLHAQWVAAGMRASMNGWSFIVLELVSVSVLCSLPRWRFVVRVLVSAVVTLVGTSLFALALSWIKQGIH